MGRPAAILAMSSEWKPEILKGKRIITAQEAMHVVRYIQLRKRIAAEQGMEWDSETDTIRPYSNRGSTKQWENGDREPSDYQGYE